MWCKKAGDDIKPESWLVVRDKDLQKGPGGSSDGEIWACMLTLRGSLRLVPPGKACCQRTRQLNLVWQ